LLGVFLSTPIVRGNVLAGLAIVIGSQQTALAGSDPSYLPVLIAEAHTQNLARSAQWHALLHYRSNLIFPGVTGQADDTRFYLHPDGKTDPEAELDATLAAIFAEPVVETEQVQHPQCQFIARYHWLRDTLHFDRQRLPEQPCTRFQSWRNELNPQALTLVFPSAYINNPSSMFGHTLLRVDAADQDEHTRLLAYSINYAVNPTDSNGAIFTLKSLIGAYPGLFSMSPYYIKVREYSDLESRDIWEYQLNFSAEEIERLLMHTWELGPVKFDYYFFDENCAYHLLSLLEVARPGLTLTERFRVWVIPLDTVRAVVDLPGVVKQTIFRPATGTRLRQRLAGMNEIERRGVSALADPKAPDVATLLTAVPQERRALLADTAYDYLRSEDAAGHREHREAATRSRALLSARSQLPTGTEFETTTPTIHPDQGHRTRRLALSVGAEAGGRYEELRLRPAYHDLLDPVGGYAEGAQINFTDLALRHYAETDEVRVEQLRVIDIVSLSPRDEFFKPISWKFNIGLDSERLTKRDKISVFRLQGGAGLAVRPWTDALLYGMVEGTLDVSGGLDGNVAFSVGPSLGLLAEPLPNWRVNLSLHYQPMPVGPGDNEHEVRLEQSYALNRDQAIRLNLSYQHEHRIDWTSIGLAWHWYF
jgi:hypothetical protein